MQPMDRPAVAAALAKWHQMVAARDLSGLPELLHSEAVLRSPMAFTPYHGAAAVALILTTVLRVFRDFVYEREFASDDGLNVALEFSACVGDKQLKGIDLIRFDESGRIVDFEVMIRPFSGLQALGDEMGKRLAAVLPKQTGAAGA